MKSKKFFIPTLYFLKFSVLLLVFSAYLPISKSWDNTGHFLIAEIAQH